MHCVATFEKKVMHAAMALLILRLQGDAGETVQQDAAWCTAAMYRLAEAANGL